MGGVPGLLRSKILPPSRAATSIVRSHLIRWDQFDAARLIVLRAPAGYGKSMMLLQWWRACGSMGPAAWLALDTIHRDPRILLAYLAATLDHAGHAIARPVASPPNSGANLDVGDHVAALINGLAGSTGPSFLFLDNVHCLNGSAASACLRILLDAAPPGLVVCVATRERLDLPLGRLRALGEVREIGPADLRFTEAEARLFLAGAGLNLAEGDLATVLARTEGWPAGLRLGLLAADRPGRVADVSGEWQVVADFFAEDVFERQPADIQQFLLRTSVLDRLSPALCDAVTGTGSGRVMLDRCEAAGLFLSASNPERTWFRYHRLFAEFLRARLGQKMPEQAVSFHDRASAWFSQAGEHAEAFRHALRAGDQIRAAEILNAHCVDDYGERLDRTIIELAAKLPADIRELYPRISLATVWPLIFDWRFDQAQAVLTACRDRLDTIRRAIDMPPDEIEDLEYLVLHREMMLSLFKDDIRLAHSLCDRLIREYGCARPMVKASFYVSMIQVQCEQYKFREIERLEARARILLHEFGHPLAFVPLESVLAQAYFMGGRGHVALPALMREVATTARHDGGDVFGAMVGLPQAEILYERNELSQATGLIDRFLRPSPEFGFIAGWISGRLTASRLRWIDGDPERALALLAEPSITATDGSFERIRLFFGAERIRLLQSLGRPDDAARIGRELGLDCAATDVLPTGRVTMRDEMRALAWVRLAQADDRLAEALKVARQWRSFVAGAQAVLSTIRWDALSACLLVADGQPRPAQRCLRRAIAAAAPGGYMRSLLDEGAPLGTLLLENPSLAAFADEPGGSFGAQLIAAFERELGRPASTRPPPAEAAEAVAEPLSSREIEMLKMVAGGLVNREIAGRLAMTEGSVKWYLHHTFRKLGAGRRAHAVTRARQLGVIA